MATDENCIFCKIIAGKIPSRKFIETDKAYAFLDIGPTAPGHSLIIPKYHAAKFHELPDDTLSDILPVAKKIALATGATDYNLLQNNGRIAHQVVDHVHFHVIPKPNEEQGLVVGWPSTNPSKEELDEVYKKMQERLEKL
ncbi:bis(5'-nucleosyl)-tetraphosphatase (asymmetrical) [Malassezia furfur]|uniref:Bis(5'-nucleosyl)-tetraphosphatase (Asymmetrical) n=1 Tax=Malassezia furfur TaxID=55194 RepID=A0ABY8EUX7_MALFU|nr:bis(5'-nucleosyl)-tetraphosphatase (asymmetrical) [Malassezia furfur]